MKIQIVVDINVTKLSSDELDGLRETVGIALSETTLGPSTRVLSIEVQE